jgi:hypothetical protein
LIGRQRTTFALAALAITLLGLAGLVLVIQNREARCAAIPLLTPELLPNATLAAGEQPQMPAGWSAAAPGVELQGSPGKGFDYNNDGRALQLIGIGNFVQTPPITVQPGARYCFTGRALTDSAKRSATRLRLIFDWRDAQNQPLGVNMTDWQQVVLWQLEAQPGDWSAILGAFNAPADATTLLIQLQPASDDRVYLDAMHVQTGGWGLGTRDRETGAPSQPPIPNPQPPIAIAPWPNGYRAAVSFSFDWETAMGGLIHSRSVDDPNAGLDWQLRAMRMRQGVTTTLDLFRPYGIRATYYANGYNFLLGNTERRQFMNNPTFAWADHTTNKKWPNDVWASTPWFANDPYGTVASEPVWYFGDLIPMLLEARQDIQSHTFSHFDGGLATQPEWLADLQSWRTVAAERGVPPARSLAFPWSSSAGMSYADWDALEAAGITSITRTKPGQPQYALANPADPHCSPVPGHERILACPDFYLHSQETAAQAITLIDHTIAVSGTIDLWAHTEEVTSPDQIAAWGQMVRYAAQQRDAGALWIAPLAEIADWQAAVAECKIENVELKTQSNASILSFKLTNGSKHDLNGLTLTLPFKFKQLTVNGTILNSQTPKGHPILNLPSGATVEVQAWPA